MGKYVIKGGRKLEGRLRCESAKNAVLPMMAAALLTEGEVIIRNCPAISDVADMAEIMRALGADVRFCGGDLVINSAGLNSYTVPEHAARKIRTSVLMLGALLSRAGKAITVCPGGCDLGGRPLDFHISALTALGAEIDFAGDKIIACTSKRRGAEIRFPFPSVGATENALLYAVTAKGITRIHNAAREPEITDLCGMLNSMGACIGGAGSSDITVYGVKRLKGTVYTPVGDRIEAGTYLIAAAVTGGKLEISGIKSENILSLLGKLRDNTCKIEIKNDIIYLQSVNRGRAFSVRTGPFPDFPTDLQAIITPLACIAEGVSEIEETVFGDRFRHTAELVKMGADITVSERAARIKGVKALTGAKVCATDLRCGAALVLAGLAAEGKTTVQNSCYVERGYAGFEEKLRMLGADIVKKE